MKNSFISVEQLASNLPIMVLLLVNGVLERGQLIHVQKLVCANVSSIPSNLGFGINVHLDVIINKIYYHLHNVHTFFPMHNPDNSPSPMPHGSTPSELVQDNQFNFQQVHLYQIYVNTNHFLK